MDTKFVKTEGILLKVQLLQSVNSVLFYFIILHNTLLIISEWTWSTRCPFCCNRSQLIRISFCSFITYRPIIVSTKHLFTRFILGISVSAVRRLFGFPCWLKLLLEIIDTMYSKWMGGMNLGIYSCVIASTGPG